MLRFFTAGILVSLVLVVAAFTMTFSWKSAVPFLGLSIAHTYAQTVPGTQPTQAAAPAQPAQQRPGKTPFDYVDPLIGTINGGHVFPGATLPFGMAKSVADVIGENQGGFTSDNNPIYGFSHMHDSGTGGSPSMGNFPIFPFAGCRNDNVTNCNLYKYQRATQRVQGSVKARPGYFAVTLNTQIKAEMTVTNHSALYRFTLPETPVGTNSTLSPLFVIDLEDLPGTASEGTIRVDAATARVTGNGLFEPSFGNGRYRPYFCADFTGAKIRDMGVYADSNAMEKKVLHVVKGNASVVNENKEAAFPAGAWVQFQKPESREMLVRFGLSFISEAQACSNAEREIPDFGFERVLRVAEEAWREKLSVVEIESGGVSEVLLKAFWSGIYRTLISPQDYTGENPLWKSDEPYYDSFYCIWDSFRSIHPLITLVDPQSQTLMVRALIDIYRHAGKLPDCRMSLCKGFTQGGSNADIVLVDAWLKNITAGIDWATAYEALISDAEVEPPNWDLEGRGNLDAYKRLGYIPKDDLEGNNGLRTRSVSRTVEYAYDDFCIALIAKDLGKMDDYNKYLQRSGNWRNLWKENQTSTLYSEDTGFKGFLQPRYKNGTWAYQDPVWCSPLLDFTGCYLNPSGGETYEGPIWLYSFFVPGDMASLIATVGGRDQFLKRLDFLHDSGLLYLGDEQAFLKVFLYHYAGHPALSAKRAHSYIPSLFNDTVGGIPGNDDSGSMGSFAALTMMGIFPNAGQDVYFITPPFFESVTLTSRQTGKKATIRNINFDPAGKNVYIQKATLNGKPYERNWLQHRFFLEGGVLELTLGPAESAWGTRPQDVPPSLGPFTNGTAVGFGNRLRRGWEGLGYTGQN
jgi:predicted alpha-1,2-mannosidase